MFWMALAVAAAVHACEQTWIVGVLAWTLAVIIVALLCLLAGSVGLLIAAAA